MQARPDSGVLVNCVLLCSLPCINDQICCPIWLENVLKQCYVEVVDTNGLVCVLMVARDHAITTPVGDAAPNVPAAFLNAT